MKIDLSGKVALVTGGSRGIGRAIALALAEAGAVVTVNYKESESMANGVVQEIESKGGRALAYRADVGSSERVDSLPIW